MPSCGRAKASDLGMLTVTKCFKLPLLYSLGKPSVFSVKLIAGGALDSPCGSFPPTVPGLAPCSSPHSSGAHKCVFLEKASVLVS